MAVTEREVLGRADDSDDRRAWDGSPHLTNGARVAPQPSVVMFVFNPVSRDRRVLKEAASLSHAGYRVTVVGINLARDLRPEREVNDDGVVILRVPVSMAPEPWRPSTRFFIRARDQLRLRRRHAAQRAHRWRGRLRLGYQRRRHRAVRWVQARTRGITGRPAVTHRGWVRRPALRGRQLDLRRLRRDVGRRWHRLRVRGRAQAGRRYRLTRAFALRQLRRSVRFATEPASRRWAVHRARRRARGAQQGVRRALLVAARAVWRPTRLVLSGIGSALFTLWAAAYLGVNRLTGGELDWALTTRQRWSRFARDASAAAPPADIYHGHDFSALGAAILAARRHGGRVVYDSHELYIESGTIGGRSALLKWLLRRVENRMYRAADHLICVNRVIAEELHRRYGGKPTTVVHNCPPRWRPPAGRPDLIRRATSIPSTSPIALYQGGFIAVRGLRQMADALLMPDTESIHLVYLGFGPLEHELRQWSRDPRYAGRLWVLPAVEPDELDAWVASADVSLMPNQPNTLNELLSTPNKLFESIAAGVPVVTSDFPERRRIVLEDPLGPLGAVCDPTNPASIASAIAQVVGGRMKDRADLRRRCLLAAHQRWNWETEGRRLTELYAALTSSRPGHALAIAS